MMPQIRIITVFTPNFNRKNTLPRVYKNLTNQTIRDFEWLIVDDSSTDGTHKLIKKWIQETNLPAFVSCAKINMVNKIEKFLALSTFGRMLWALTFPVGISRYLLNHVR